MGRQDYVHKYNQPLTQPAYRAIPRDPTNKIKTKLINILKRVKSWTVLDNDTNKAMYPTDCRAPKFYGLPKIHKQGTPLRPVVSSYGSITYGVAKEVTKILKPLVGTLNSAYNEKKICGDFASLQTAFCKGDVIIGEFCISGAEIFLCYSQFFVKGNFIIGGVWV